VPQRVENAIKERLKKRALEKCSDVVDKYADCTRGRTFSSLWACRSSLLEVTACTKKYTSENEINKLKMAYIELENARLSSSDIQPSQS
jgi:COX assembly protein 1